MVLDINFLIDFFKKKTNKTTKKDVDEQETPDAGTSTPTGGGGGSVPKWADTVGGPQRGKANMLGKGGEKWQTGMNRGVANQIW